MFPLTPKFRKFRPAFFAAFLILFFCFIFPTWNASAKMDVLQKQASTVMFEPVSKVVSYTRRFLLGRLESARVKELLDQTLVVETASVFHGSEEGRTTPL